MEDLNFNISIMQITNFPTVLTRECMPYAAVYIKCANTFFLHSLPEFRGM